MAIPLIIMGVAAAASAGAQAYGGIASKRQRKKQAARLRQAANETRKEAAAEAAIIREKGERVQSEAKAMYAYSGVSSEGTPQAVRLTIAKNVEREAVKAIRQGEYRARQLEWGGETQEYMGKAEQGAGLIGAGTTLLKGAGSIWASASSASGGGKITGGATETAEDRGAFDMKYYTRYRG